MRKTLDSIAHSLGGEREKHPKRIASHDQIVTADRRFLSKIGMEGKVDVYTHGSSKQSLLLSVRETKHRLSMMALAMLGQEFTGYLKRRHDLTLSGVYWEIAPDADIRVEWPDESHLPHRIHVRELDPDQEAQVIADLIRANQPHPPL